MTVNYQELVPKIQRLVEAAKKRSQELSHTLQTAQNELVLRANDLEALRGKIERAAEADPSGLRCAFPFSEPLDAHLPAEEIDPQYLLFAADGSQILPDRHAEVYYGLINVGGIVIPWGINQEPKTLIQSQLLYGADVEDMTDARLAIQRDILERQMILQLAQGCQPPFWALVDGPLELWIGREGSDRERRDYQQGLEIYFGLLDRLYQARLPFAGYVDRPDSGFVVRMLEVAMMPGEDFTSLRGYHPLAGVTDADVFLPILGAGERSAVFALRTAVTRRYPPHSTIFFFYMNVGRQADPWLARVEIPAWVAQDTRLVNFLQAGLARQCRVSGVNSYPYILHRAHELAVVHPDEKEQITRMILTEFQRQGLPPGRISHKQALKNLPVRKTNGKLRR